MNRNYLSSHTNQRKVTQLPDYLIGLLPKKSRVEQSRMNRIGNKLLMLTPLFQRIESIINNQSIKREGKHPNFEDDEDTRTFHSHSNAQTKPPPQ